MHKRILVILVMLAATSNGAQAQKKSHLPSGCWKGQAPVAVVGRKNKQLFDMNLVFSDRSEYLDGLYFSDSNGDYVTDFSCSRQTMVSCQIFDDGGSFHFRQLSSKLANIEILGQWQMDRSESIRHPTIYIKPTSRKIAVSMIALDPTICEKEKAKIRNLFEHGGDPDPTDTGDDSSMSK